MLKTKEKKEKSNSSKILFYSFFRDKSSTFLYSLKRTELIGLRWLTPVEEVQKEHGMRVLRSSTIMSWHDLRIVFPAGAIDYTE